MVSTKGAGALYTRLTHPKPRLPAGSPHCSHETGSCALPGLLGNHAHAKMTHRACALPSGSQRTAWPATKVGVVSETAGRWWCWRVCAPGMVVVLRGRPAAPRRQRHPSDYICIVDTLAEQQWRTAAGIPPQNHLFEYHREAVS
eukprot:365937-Chlamydomonas_euryale.AAC.3